MPFPAHFPLLIRWIALVPVHDDIAVLDKPAKSADIPVENRIEHDHKGRLPEPEDANHHPRNEEALAGQA